MTLIALGVQAQSTRTITGFVIDKYGNPIPGALVEATHGAENVTTEADGTFTMEIPYYLNSMTAKYVGMKTKKVKIDEKDKIVIVMPSKKKGPWFINASATLNADLRDGDTYYFAGAMFGYMAEYGGYGKILLPIIKNTHHLIPSVTCGPIFGLNKKVFLYCGIGYTSLYYSENYYYSNYYTKYHYSSIEFHNGMTTEIGTIFNLNHFNLGVGLSFSTDFRSLNRLGFQLSAGYCF